MMPSLGTADRKIRCVVIQLGSLASTLQSLAALKSAKEQYPGLEFHVIATDSSARALERVAWIDRVQVLPAEEIVTAVTSGKLREKHALGSLARWISPLVQFRWDFLVNWTYSPSSSYLAALIPARVKLGFTRRKDLSLSAPDGWSRYFQAIVQGNLPQKIHVTDILSTQLLTALQIHCGMPNHGTKSLGVFSADVQTDARSLTDIARSEWANRDRSKKWIAIQLDAFGPKPGWGSENWGRLASKILKRHTTHSVVLLGTDAARNQASHILAEIRREGQNADAVLNLTGQTDFNFWSAIVGSVPWLLCGDSAAGHLASLLGTRVLGIVNSTARLDSGPYGNGHYVISPAVECIACSSETGERHSCRDAVAPEAVYAAWSYGSSEWSHLRKDTLETHFSRLGVSHELASLQIHRSRVRSIDEGGGVDYENVLNRPTPLADWNAMILEHLARELYCGWTPQIDQLLANVRVGPELLRSAREIAETSHVLSKISSEAKRTSIRLSEKSGALRSENVMSLEERMALHSLSADIHKLEELIQRLSSNQPVISALARLHAVMMHNLSGVRLTDVSGEASMWYSQLAESANRVQEWASQSLLLGRPVAVAKGESSQATERPETIDPLE